MMPVSTTRLLDFFMKNLTAFLEVGKKKIFAGSTEWPGYCRWAKSEEDALQALVDYGPRYAKVLDAGGLTYTPIQSVEQIEVVERHPGTATTDFGGTSAKLEYDTRPIDTQTLQFFLDVMQTCWKAFDQAAEQAVGRELSTGPRGGGRDPEKIKAHIFESERAYLRRIAGKFKADQDADLDDEMHRLRQTILDAFAQAVTEGLPDTGPRGGKIWTPRYFVRRLTWHTLDHAWEIEDRMD